MNHISLDIETYSSVDLSKSSVYRYSEAPDFEILLLGYSVDDDPVQVVDLASGERIPEEILAALTDERVTKWAFNANFERVCLSRYLGMPNDEFLDPAQWHCTMIWSAYLGLPLSLMGVGAALALDKQKLSEGKELIRYFCQPCAATKANGGRTRNLPQDAPEKWTLFKAYNLRDVETEMGIQKRLCRYPVPEDVWEQYHQDQAINDRGIAIDRQLVESAIQMDMRSRAELTEQMQKLTCLENPNSVQQMKKWLAEHDVPTESLGKKQVAALLKDCPEDLREVLILRQQLAKSSVKKYIAMRNAACADGRVRGAFQFYGANRSGRWAGRNVQLQNLPQNHMEELAEARACVRRCDYEAVEQRYGSVPDVLSELIRTAFIPSAGRKLIVSDFSAVEARVIAWLAGEQWRMEVFAHGGDIYCASASQMFGVPVEKHGVNGHLRQKGKIAELALGYGGSVGALKAMGALEMGLTEEELPTLVRQWRSANPHITRLWWDVDEAVMKAVRDKTSTYAHGIRFHVQSGMLFIHLPSGRDLCYAKPRIGENQFGSPAVTYMGVGATKKWERMPRLDTLLIDYLGADDTPYVRAATRKTLTAGVARIYEPGVKFDSILVLNGPQGIGKSTFFARLGKKWYSDSLTIADMKDKTAPEKLQGYWLLEISELAGMKKMDVETVKSFITRTDDKYRQSYGVSVESHPRSCIIVGTTNSDGGFLRDITGNRRFWPVRVSGGGKLHPWDMKDIDQIWAEAVCAYRNGEELFLKDDVAAEAYAQQREAMESDDREGVVQDYLDRLLPADWDKYDLYQRRSYFGGSDFGTPAEGTVRRDRVCAMEIWCECFGKAREALKKADSYEIEGILYKLGGWKKYEGSSSGKARFIGYGVQKCYVRVSDVETETGTD